MSWDQAWTHVLCALLISEVKRTECEDAPRNPLLGVREANSFVSDAFACLGFRLTEAERTARTDSGFLFLTVKRKPCELRKSRETAGQQDEKKKRETHAL